ncbi:Transcriptional activator hap5 [Rhodosporidiobolus nylandii]
MSDQQTPAKPKTQRATTSSKNRPESPPPYLATSETTIEDFVQDFWQHALNVAEHHEDDFKHQALPLARIKKVAKMDPEVQNQMISSEVTVLFEKACQIFIQELTARAHLVSMAARRRTLSRADVASAVSKSDTFDFLIDIVPRAERAAASTSATTSNAGASTSGGKRPARSRKPSQRDDPPTPADEMIAHPLMPPPVEASSAALDGEEGDEDDEDGRPAKRFRPEEQGQPGTGGSGVYALPGMAGAGVDPATAQAAAQAAMAAAAGYYGYGMGGGVGADGQATLVLLAQLSRVPADSAYQFYHAQQHAHVHHHVPAANGDTSSASGANGENGASGQSEAGAAQ